MLRFEKITVEAFDRVAQSRCSGWGDRALTAVRMLLVEGRRAKDVATELTMSQPQVYVLRRRFFDRYLDVVKVPAVEFMARVPPDRATQLGPFKADVRQLIKFGYSPAQVGEFLQANDIELTVVELADFLEQIK